MSDCDLVRLLRFPGSPPIQLRAAEEIIRLREEVERLKTMVFRSEVLEIRSLDSEVAG